MTDANHPTPALEIDAVRFCYEQGAPVLDGVSLRVEQGEFVCIIGANGSGKSTLARHMNALLVPDEGSVRVFGHATNDPASTLDIRTDVAMVFQNPDDQLICTLVEDEVAFGPGNLGVSPAELRTRVDESLDFVGLGGFQKREVSKLSGGQKQLVALAGAIAMHPRVLVLDEATAMVDPASRRALWNVCENLRARGCTIVAITQLMDEAARADYVVVLNKGRVALEGTPNEVLLRVEELEACALEAPSPCKLAYELQARGIPVQPTLNETDLEEQLCRLFSIA